MENSAYGEENREGDGEAKRIFENFLLALFFLFFSFSIFGLLSFPHHFFTLWTPFPQHAHFRAHSCAFCSTAAFCFYSPVPFFFLPPLSFFLSFPPPSLFPSLPLFPSPRTSYFHLKRGNMWLVAVSRLVCLGGLKRNWASSLPRLPSGFFLTASPSCAPLPISLQPPAPHLPCIPSTTDRMSTRRSSSSSLANSSSS